MSVEQKALKYKITENKIERDKLFIEISDDLQGVIKGIATKWVNSLPVDQADIENELLIVLLQVLEDYDSSRDAKLRTVCNTYFTNKLNNLYNKFKAEKRCNIHGHDYSMERLKQSNDRELKQEFAQSISFTVDNYEEAEMKVLLNELELREKERSICNMLVEGFTNKSEIARRIGITPAGVHYLIDQVRGKIKLAIA